ncbi:MAG: AAA family ATPase [Candidatus Heimdallarchaeota archaeon]|nr:AAA family ATPase [Candidatus Heimdallarchaeota archaeon]
MSKNLLITSINPGVGKTTITLALALKLRQKGKNVGYFKPITDRVEDSDAADAKSLLKMEEPVEIINPALVSSYEYDMTDKQRNEILDKIRAAYETIKKNYDFLLIETCRRINYLSFLELSSSELAQEFNADVLILAQGKEVEDSDRIILGMKYFSAANVTIVGSIMTLVPDQIFDHFKTVIVPKLEQKFGVDILGLVPDRITLAAPTVREVASAINAKILAGKNHLDKLIENYIVGAMQPEAALKYFRRSMNKAVITGGDRPQLIIAAMETSTSAVILTGGILPSARVIATAEEKGIPILLVQTDTFTTTQKVTESPIYGKLHVEQADKINAWAEILEEVDYKKILAKLESQ